LGVIRSNAFEFIKTTLTRFIAFILVTLTSITAFAGPRAPIDPADYTAPVRVACVGASITLGVGAEKGKSYPSQLQAILGDKWQVKNFGVSGRTLMKKGDHPYWIEKAFRDAQDFKPDVVVILIGSNDTKPKNWVHHDEFEADYKEMVETFKNLESKPRVFICRLPPVPAPGNYGINEANLDLEIPMIDQVAHDEGVGIIDIHAALVDKPELLPDHVHPNTAGAGVMARTVADVLTGKAAKSP
jgi:lysophospholipase L1-like esterase